MEEVFRRGGDKMIRSRSRSKKVLETVRGVEDEVIRNKLKGLKRERGC